MKRNEVRKLQAEATKIITNRPGRESTQVVTSSAMNRHNDRA